MLIKFKIQIDEGFLLVTIYSRSSEFLMPPKKYKKMDGQRHLKHKSRYVIHILKYFSYFVYVPTKLVSQIILIFTKKNISNKNISSFKVNMFSTTGR